MAQEVPQDVQEANNRKAIALAQAEQAKAEKEAAVARAEIEGAVLKAKLANLQKNEIKPGEITVTNAGNAEATMLAARAASEAADKIATSVNALVADPSATIVVVGGPDKLSLGHWQLFQLQALTVTELFKRANGLKAEADKAYTDAMITPRLDNGAQKESVPFVAGAGIALDLAAKIASYFQTDYAFGSSNVDVGVDHAMLAENVAGLLKAKTIYPGRWVGAPVFAALQAELYSLADKAQDAQIAMKIAQRKSLELNDAAKDAANGKKKTLTGLAASYDDAVAAYTVAQKSYGDMIEKLAAVDTKDQPAALVIAEEMFIAQTLEKPNTYVLFVRMNAAAGANYTKKNIWTFLGATPFYVQGGVTTSYILVSGAEGFVKGSGSFTLTSGYLPVAHVKNVVDGMP